jgi:hypothetical protein
MSDRRIRVTDDLTTAYVHERPRPKGEPPLVNGGLTRSAAPSKPKNPPKTKKK